MSEPKPWHRLFGLSLVDFFRGMPVSVELEKDLSLKQQLLDVVLIRKDAAPLPCQLPEPGVYDVNHYTGVIRLVVVHELPQVEHNALLHLFSARIELLRYGVAHYRRRSAETSTLLQQLFQRYHLEATQMPTSLEQLQQFAEETIENLLKELPVERRLKGLSPDALLAAMSPEERAVLAQRLKDYNLPPKPPADPQE